MMCEEAAGNLRRLLSKLPEWADAAPSLKIPSRLNIEQCSSGVTARYKAALAVRNLSPECIADLTGGLGADCLAFSRICRTVLYNEKNAELASAVESNFAALGVHNVVFRSCCLRPAGVGEALAGGGSGRTLYIWTLRAARIPGGNSCGSRTVCPMCSL